VTIVAPAKELKLSDLERETIRQALERNGGNRKAAAAELGLSERTLYRKIKEYEL
jgi:transcriptional regulator with PAS, ATPase and Fis domain